MTIFDILALDAEERKKTYKAEGLDTVTIDGNTIEGYGAFSFIWEKSYAKSPERSASGAIDNLDSYATFVTPHLKIDFALMSIDDYRTVMKLLYARNEHIVQCYDIVNNKTVTNRMYFATEEMPKLLTIARALNGERWVELLGVQDYTVELIGTNSGVEKTVLTYNLNVPADATWDGETTADVKFPKNTTLNVGEDASILVGEETKKFQDLTFGDKFVFNGWNTSADGTGLNYINGEEYYFMGDTVLYAQWK